MLLAQSLRLRRQCPPNVDDPLVGIGDGIVELGGIPSSLVQGNTLELDLRWGGRAAPTRDLEAQLSLVDGAGVGVPRRSGTTGIEGRPSVSMGPTVPQTLP